MKKQQKDKEIAYLVTFIDGRHSEFPRLAKNKLEILCDVLNERGYVKSLTMSSSNYFELGKPNILKLADFFDNPKNLNLITDELSVLNSNKEFAKRLFDESCYNEGYFVARLVGTNYVNDYGHNLAFQLKGFKEMHDGFDYAFATVAKPKEAATTTH